MNVPRDWKLVTLVEVAMPRRVGVDPRTRPGEVFVGLEHIESQTTRITGRSTSEQVRSTSYQFAPGDTLYSRLRPYLNKVTEVNFAGLASGEFIILPPSPAFASRFLMYLLNQPGFVEFTGTLDTGDRPRVRWDQISSYQFALPPRAEQERIVAAIEEEFSRIDAAAGRLEQAGLRVRSLVSKALDEAVGVGAQ